MDTRIVPSRLAYLALGIAAIALIAVCTQTATPTLAQGCSAAVPWVSGGYDNGKWVPAHCQGYPAQ